MSAPTLVFAWGNPARGDDALGPALLAALREAEVERAGTIELLEDYQLQVEHALDLLNRRRVLFVDASVQAAAPFATQVVVPVADASFTTHALQPAALLHACTMLGHAAPPSWQLAIRGERFELGEDLSAAARRHLAAAVAWTLAWLATPIPSS